MNQWSKILLCALFLVYSHAALALRVNAFEKQVNTFLQRADHSSEGDKWAVLVAGSNGWWNYRHQADVCHAYQIIKSKGFPDSRIIVMRYDDIAYNMQNPLQGVVLNRESCIPTKKTDSGNWVTKPGCNVNMQCGRDYYGAAVSPQNFLHILRGDEERAQESCDDMHKQNTTYGGCNAKVVKSGPKDHIFVAYFDHGATHLIGFPTASMFGPVKFLTADDLMDTLTYMYNNELYDEMVLYIEACESGSMFNGLLTDDLKIWATTASDPFHSSYACYCNTFLDGKTPFPCLGDLYSTQWMEDVESHDMDVETFRKDFKRVRNGTTMSRVCEYGDQRLEREHIASFMEYTSDQIDEPGEDRMTSKSLKGIVDAREATMHYLKRAYTAPDIADNALSIQRQEFEAQEQHQTLVDKYMSKILSELQYPLTKPDQDEESDLCFTAPHAFDKAYFECLKGTISKWEELCAPLSEYTLKYVQAFSNLCTSGITADEFGTAALNACMNKKIVS